MRLVPGHLALIEGKAPAQIEAHPPIPEGALATRGKMVLEVVAVPLKAVGQIREAVLLDQEAPGKVATGIPLIGPRLRELSGAGTSRGDLAHGKTALVDEVVLLTDAGPIRGPVLQAQEVPDKVVTGIPLIALRLRVTSAAGLKGAPLRVGHMRLGTQIRVMEEIVRTGAALRIGP